MSYIDIANDLKLNIAKIINLRTNNSFLLSKEARLELTQITTNFYDFFVEKNSNYSSFYERYLNKKNADQQKLQKNILDLKNNYNKKQTNITNIHDKEIQKIQKQISFLKSRLNQDLNDSNESYLKETALLKQNIKVIDQALDLNTIFYKNKHVSSETNYSFMINKANFASQKQIEKFHAENSRKTVIQDENDNTRLMQIKSQIAKLKDKIREIENELSQKQETLKSKILSESVILNSKIKELTSAKNKKNYLEKDKNNIKISDLQIQENQYQAAFNKKTKSIMEDFAKKLVSLDNDDEFLTKEYKNNVEDYTRNHYYSYYSCLYELNDFISKQNKVDASETRAVRKAKNKLYCLKLESYYDKLDTLKLDFKNQIKLFEDNYEFNTKKIKIEKNLAEINKNYEIEIATLEYESQKASIQLLHSFIVKQEANRSAAIDIEFEKEANNARKTSLTNVEKLQRENEKITIDYQIKIAKIKNDVDILEHDYQLITDLAEIRRTKDLKISKANSELKRVVTMLELDKNKLLNNFNLAQTEYQILIAKNISIRNKALIKEKLDYLIQKENANETSLYTNFSYNEAPFNYQIEIHRYKKRFEHLLENVQYKKNLSLAKVTGLRKNFRFDALSIANVGNFIYQVLKATNSYILEMLLCLDKNYHLENANKGTIAKEIISAVSSFQIRLINDFASLTNNIIKNRIYSVTNSKFETLHNSNIERYQEEKNQLNSNIKLIKETIAKYEDTKCKLKDTENEIIDSLKQKNANLSIVTRFTNMDFYQLKQHLKSTRSSTDKINKKISYFQEVLKDNTIKLSQLDKKFQIEDKNFEKQRRIEYSSYYSLSENTNKYKKKFINKLKKAYFASSIFIQNNLARESAKLNKKIETLLVNTFNNYLNIFNNFKKENEYEFNHTQKNVMYEFKSTLKKYVHTLNKELKAREKRYKTKLSNLKQEVAMAKKLIENADSMHKVNNKYIYSIHKEKARNDEIAFLATKRKFHQDIWAISKNIQYLMNNADNLMRETEVKYWHDYYALTSSTNNAKKTSSNNTLMYIRRKQNDLNNLPNIEKRNIAEIKKQNQDKDSRIDLIKEQSKKEIQELRHKYQSERIKIITDNTKSLLEERINHNRNIQKVKRNLDIDAK